ncbi:MAG: hypothetical protein VKK59_06605 [Vampirovibrionales bacterium]|nr:hypothetical protein [Vampirovibrionales bacterium]
MLGLLSKFMPGVCLVACGLLMFWLAFGFEKALAQNTVFIELPARTQLAIALSAPLDSRTAQAGDTVCGQLTHAIRISTSDAYNDTAVAQNARVCGTIRRIEPPAEGRDTVMSIQFGVLEAILPWGTEAIVFQGHLKTPHSDHTLGGWLTPGAKARHVPYRVTQFNDYSRALWESKERLMGRSIYFETGSRLVVVLDEAVRISPSF